MSQLKSDERPPRRSSTPPLHDIGAGADPPSDTPSRPISVMLVDDHPLFRDAVKRVLDKHLEFHVVAETDDGLDAARLAATLRPDVAVLDIGLRGTSGLVAVHKIKAESPGTAILVLTVHDDAEHVRSMLQGGASGFLTKDVLGGEVVEAIRRVAAGDIYLCPVALRHVVATAVSDSATTSGCGSPRLTPRETEVLALLSQGLSNREIAERLSLSTRTVKGHLEEIFSKLEVDSRTAAVTAALRLRLLEVQDL